MIYQLANGRTVEIPTEKYLEMTDKELHDLEALLFNPGIEVNDPWYESVLNESNDIEQDLDDYPDLNELDEE